MPYAFTPDQHQQKNNGCSSDNNFQLCSILRCSNKTGSDTNSQILMPWRWAEASPHLMRFVNSYAERAIHHKLVVGLKNGNLLVDGKQLLGLDPLLGKRPRIWQQVVY